MLDLGWSELAMIALLTVIVVGPKELPRVLRTVTQGMRKIRNMAGEFQSSIDEMAREAELEDLQKKLRDQANNSMQDHLNSIDPTGETSKIVEDVKSTIESESKEAHASTTELRDAAKSLADQNLEEDAMGDEPVVDSPRTSAKKTSAKKTAAKKAGTKKTATKKTVAKKAIAKKATAKNASAKKAAAKKSAAKKTALKNAALKSPDSTKADAPSPDSTNQSGSGSSKEAANETKTEDLGP